MHRLDFKVFLGSAGIGRRQQASEGQRDTHVRVPGYGVADLSRRLNDAALIENSTPRSSPPLEAAAPALAVVTGLPPNPTRQAARLAATPHGTAPVPSRGAALSGHPHCGAFISMYFILLYTFYSHFALLSVQPFWRHLSEATATSRRGFSRRGPALGAAPLSPPRPYRGAVFRVWAAARAAPTAPPRRCGSASAVSPSGQLFW